MVAHRTTTNPESTVQSSVVLIYFPCFFLLTVNTWQGWYGHYRNSHRFSDVHIFLGVAHASFPVDTLLSVMSPTHNLGCRSDRALSPLQQRFTAHARRRRRSSVKFIYDFSYVYTLTVSLHAQIRGRRGCRISRDTKQGSLRICIIDGARASKPRYRQNRTRGGPTAYTAAPARPVSPPRPPAACSCARKTCAAPATRP